MDTIAQDILFSEKEILSQTGYDPSIPELNKIEKWAEDHHLPLPSAVVIYMKNKKAGISESEIEDMFEKHDGYPGPSKFFVENQHGNETFSEHRMAKYLKKYFHFFTFRDTGELYIYKQGRYIPKGKTYVEEAVEKLLGYRYRDRFPKRVVKKLKHSTYTDRTEVNNNQELLNCANCLVDISNRNTKSHTPRNLTTTQIPVKYDPQATCPKFKQFLDEIVDKKQKKEKLQEMFGYALAKHYDYQKAFLLHGEGSNGKSALLNVLSALIGEPNTCAIELQELEKRFQKPELSDRLTNIASDISDKTLEQTSYFKKLTGGDKLKAEEKFQKPFHFRNYATLIFSANQIPKVENKQTAFYRRWIIIEFPYKFTTNPHDNHKDADPDIVEKITTDKELSGILNWAIEGYQRLKKQGRFTGQRSTQQVKAIYERQSDPVSYFAIQKIRPANNWIKKDDLYQQFLQFCGNHSLKHTSKQDFCRRIKNLTPATDRRKRINGKRQTGFTGIKVV